MTNNLHIYLTDSGSLGQRIIEAVIKQPMFRIAEEGFVVWEANAAEQLEAVVADYKYMENLVKEFREYQNRLTEDERVDLWERLIEGFCGGCGCKEEDCFCEEEEGE